jgi:hypothetical protein
MKILMGPVSFGCAVSESVPNDKAIAVPTIVVVVWISMSDLAGLKIWGSSERPTGEHVQ